jgi:hypothetical protein
VRRSANTVGVVALRLLYTMMRPLFSATNTRPSGEKRTATGLIRPLSATVSWKPEGTAGAAGALAESASGSTTAAASASNRMPR